MRRAASLLPVAVAFLGCGVVQPLGEPVPLVTGVGPYGDGCFTFVTTVTLVADAEYGTVDGGGSPVMWRPGYSGRRLDSGEVVVLNESGGVVATTGNTYALQGAGADYHGMPVFWACGLVMPEPT